MSTTANLPDKREVRACWAGRLVNLGKFDSIYEAKEGDYCFACGFGARTERAHIRPRCNGGSDDVENLHLLCRVCHRDSELLEGQEYYDWLRGRTIVDVWYSPYAGKNSYDLDSPQRDIDEWR